MDLPELNKELVNAKLRWKYHPLRAFFEDIYRTNPVLFQRFLNRDYSTPDEMITGSISPSIIDSIRDCPEDIPSILQGIVQANIKDTNPEEA